MSSPDVRTHADISLPIHLQIGWGTRVFYATNCAIAFLLHAVLVAKIVLCLDKGHWPAVFFFPLGMVVADFLSGIIHWGADTWGSESMPILGKRLLHPFRVHHVNPADFLRRQFIDTNGDVAFLALPLLVLALCIPLTDVVQSSCAVFMAAFTGVGLMTNQIHQWAHMRRAPWPVSWLQQIGVILSHEEHERHHRPPHIRNYCIATGWCNRPLETIQFFPRLERWITRWTGFLPRSDEQAFVNSARGTQPEATR